MAYKAELGLHIYDDVCAQSWHILCSGCMHVLRNSLALPCYVGNLYFFADILMMLLILNRHRVSEHAAMDRHTDAGDHYAFRVVYNSCEM